MMDIQYFIFSVNDIEKYKTELISLMEIVLHDNITQDYPADLSKQYVAKMPGFIADGSAVIVGAKHQEQLIGFSWAYELSIFGERRIHIDMIGVDENFRRNGIGSTMVKMQIDEARKRHITIMEAMTTRANEHSYQSFHSMGFVDERVKVMLDIGEQKTGRDNHD